MNAAHLSQGSWVAPFRKIITRFVTMNLFLVGLRCCAAFMSRRRGSTALPISWRGEGRGYEIGRSIESAIQHSISTSQPHNLSCCYRLFFCFAYLHRGYRILRGHYGWRGARSDRFNHVSQLTDETVSPLEFLHFE